MRRFLMQHSCCLNPRADLNLSCAKEMDFMGEVEAGYLLTTPSQLFAKNLDRPVGKILLRAQFGGVDL